MALLGALEHGVYMEKDSDDDDECHGMSIVQIHQYFGLDKDGSDVEMPVSAEEEEQVENVGNIGVEDLISDDDLEDWLACFLGSDSEDKIEELHDLDHDGICFIFISMSLCLSSNFRTLHGNSMRVICTMSL